MSQDEIYKDMIGEGMPGKTGNKGTSLQNTETVQSIIADRNADVSAAYEFLDHMGMNNPTPDMVEQLLDAFVPALRIMYERGYDPNGGTWREGGWRSIVQELRKKTFRIWHKSWRNSEFDADNGVDLINYAGYYHRLKCSGMPFGDWGEPDAVSYPRPDEQHAITGTSQKILP